jgi:predicted Rossmann fold flavoprotein
MLPMQRAETDTDIFIAGAGASGLAAACAAAEAGVRVICADSNEKPGRKLAATGNGRCNITNEFCNALMYNREAVNFVRHVIHSDTVEKTVGWFEDNGLLIVSEQEGRCYPYSGQASSVADMLTETASSRGVQFILGDRIAECSSEDGIFVIRFDSGKTVTAGKLVIATGGRAGLRFGSTGDGYGFAKSFGHTLNAPRPALVACESDDPVISGIKGRARAKVTLIDNGVQRYSEYGEVQFTGTGLSGICVMNITRYIKAARPANRKKGKDAPEKSQDEQHEYILRLNFMPEIDGAALAELLVRSMKEVPLGKALSWIVNSRIADKVVELSSGDTPEKRAESAVKLLQGMDVKVKSTKGWNEAQVTRGGVKTDEVNYENMESRIVPGLYFCGEVLDVDGPCGGFNLQWAWSSGFLCGRSAAEACLAED